MKKVVCLMVATVFLMTAGLVWAQEKRGSAAQAKVLIDRGYEYVQKNGVKAAIAEFNKPDGQFVKDDLFIMVVDFNAKVVAYATNHKLIGRGSMQSKDADGKLFIKAMVDTAKTKGSGWVDYKYINPKTKKPEQKTTYVKKISDNLLMACGAYK